MEKVDILVPPDFKKSSIVKTREQAWCDGDWIGTFNLWIVKSKPVPAIIYQQRSPNSTLAPNKLDVTAGGHYFAGETTAEGLREVDEELGRHYQISEIVKLGRKIYLGFDKQNRLRHNLVDVFMVLDNSPLKRYRLQPDEVAALFECPITELKRVHEQTAYQFSARGLDAYQKPVSIKVNRQSFPYNWDNYHRKIVYLAERLLKGEKNLFY